MEATRGPFEASDGLQRPSEGPSEGNRGSLRRPEALRENAGVTRPGLHQRSGSYAQFWLSVACRRVPSCRKKTMWWHPRPPVYDDSYTLHRSRCEPSDCDTTHRPLVYDDCYTLHRSRCDRAIVTPPIDPLFMTTVTHFTDRSATERF